MRQNDNSSNRDKARPADRATTLAERLQSLHHANIRQGLEVLGKFASEEMQDAQAEELAATLRVVWRDKDVFDAIMIDYLHLLNMVKAFLIRQGGNSLAVAQLNRIENGLDVSTFHGEHGTSAVVDVPPVRRWLMDKAVIAAAILLALFAWNVISGHCEPWRLLFAIVLVAGICGAAFRAGQRLQTSVSIGRVAAGTTAEGKPGR
jgi:cobalamin biosynthesis Mg chelatase CobN